MAGVDHIDSPRNEPGTDERAIPLSKVLLVCLAIVSVATAVVHFAVSGQHFQDYWAFGVFMLVVAWMQLVWAAVAATRPSRLLLWTGAILNAGVVAVYIVTRTVGDVIGPTPHDIEPFGFGDGLTTVLEAVLVVGCIWLLATKTDRRVQRDRLVKAAAATGAAVAVLLSVALVDGGSEMVMSMDSSAAAPTTTMNTMPGMTMPTPALSTSSLRLPTTTPAGDITMPNPNMQMESGMKMASSSACHAAPTKAQQNAAVSLVDNSWAGSSKYQSLAAAKAAGYVPITPAGKRVVHYANPAYYRATVRGGPILDTAAPQSLVYANTPKGAVLVAAMYITSPHGPTPQPGGCLTQWHVHTNLCLTKGAGVVGAVGKAGGACPTGSANKVTPAMLHVWFVPIPGGPTAVDATNAQVVHAAEQVASPVNGRA